jgi:hypothetical protein
VENGGKKLSGDDKYSLRKEKLKKKKYCLIFGAMAFFSVLVSRPWRLVLIDYTPSALTVTPWN